MRNSGRKDGKNKAEKVEPTEVVEGDRRVQENQNLEVSCTGSVHAWKQCYDNQLMIKQRDYSHVPTAATSVLPRIFSIRFTMFTFAGCEFAKERPGLRP